MEKKIHLQYSLKKKIRMQVDPYCTSLCCSGVNCTALLREGWIDETHKVGCRHAHPKQTALH